jgi:hypothetical protein
MCDAALGETVRREQLLNGLHLTIGDIRTNENQVLASGAINAPKGGQTRRAQLLEDRRRSVGLAEGRHLDGKSVAQRERAHDGVLTRRRDICSR